MDNKVILGATMAAAAGYFGAKMIADLDESTSIGAGLGLSMVVASSIKFSNGSKNEGLSEEDLIKMEEELMEGGRAQKL